ncbi:trigger factor [Desulforamulus hydrothermalis]|uniref:Trigger factor n=1 Tax=Desulforamulus hydrothermalis Lam5 = DSM 18033 TaxID=1121428 RepID=K8EG53_9FIRM|nr:trigger factor [Desulforamulus hydrothermalis]CCO07661.1 Trigger factor [Desulforamulus hydrothermalis Lam5 = DSM 18033]SHH24798.1 trigger factor [Desulforamulus hydrothermalis Lam5 = DSM 18033]
MKATAERIEKNTVLLEVEVETEKVEQAMQQAYRNIVKKVNIPGFRKGKAPRALVERFVGKETLFGEAAEIIVPEAYMQALEETKTEPIDRPKIDIVQGEPGKPLIFKATVEVKPEVTLGEYKGIEVKRPSTEVSDEDVQAELARLQNRYAKLVTVEEGEVQKDDITIIDFAGYVDGEAFPGGTAENYSLTIGSGAFIPGFEDQLIGAKVGEEKEVNVTFPQEYHAEDLAGKPATFKVTVKEIKRKELAPLDDEFAKDVSEFDTLEELKSDIRNKLKEAAEARAKSAVENGVVEAVAANASVEIPAAMIEQKVDEMLNSVGQRLAQQGINLDQYFQFTNTSLADMRQRMKPDAEKTVKNELVLDAVARAENIQVSEEEINQEIRKIADYVKQDAEIVRKTLELQGELGHISQDIARRKAVSFLVENASIVEDTVQA